MLESRKGAKRLKYVTNRGMKFVLCRCLVGMERREEGERMRVFIGSWGRERGEGGWCRV